MPCVGSHPMTARDSRSPQTIRHIHRIAFGFLPDYPLADAKRPAAKRKPQAKQSLTPPMSRLNQQTMALSPAAKSGLRHAVSQKCLQYWWPIQRGWSR